MGQPTTITITAPDSSIINTPVPPYREKRTDWIALAKAEREIARTLEILVELVARLSQEPNLTLDYTDVIAKLIQ